MSMYQVSLLDILFDCLTTEPLGSGRLSLSMSRLLASSNSLRAFRMADFPSRSRPLGILPSFTIFICRSNSQFSTRFLYIRLILPTDPTLSLTTSFSVIPSVFRFSSIFWNSSADISPELGLVSETWPSTLYSISMHFSAMQGIENWKRLRLPGKKNG